MNIEFFRSIFYPLGLLANILFSARFFLQWIQSERKKNSHVTPSFWGFSLAGNMMMAVHGLFQLQYPLFLIQSLNGLIAWRNLDLMREKPKSFYRMLLYIVLTFFSVTLLFVGQGLFFHSLNWMRSPTFPWSSAKSVISVSIFWHVLGFSSMILFASRFWIQWWMAEKRKESFLGKTFWWISLIGAIFSLIYFIQIRDIVNILGYSVGLIPYLRNLILLKKQKNESKASI